jgi:hypothetical protein
MGLWLLSRTQKSSLGLIIRIDVRRLPILLLGLLFDAIDLVANSGDNRPDCFSGFVAGSQSRRSDTSNVALVRIGIMVIFPEFRDRKPQAVDLVER